MLWSRWCSLAVTGRWHAGAVSDRSTGELSRVVLAAGGTAGHVFPALAIRDELIDRGVDVKLYCDDRALRYVEGFGDDEIEVIPSGGIVTGSPLTRLRNAVRLVRGLVTAWRRLGRDRPDLVIGLGGYAAVGPILGAGRRGIPNVLHEQNSIMGTANKLSAGRADAVALTFDPTVGAKGNCTVTGNPTRRSVAAVGEAPYPTPAAADSLGILVMGGSQGARVVSDRVPAALAAISSDLRNRLRVVHQARAEDHDRVVEAYSDAGIVASVLPFVDVPTTLVSTHLVISRAGATTVCDVAVARRPAVYLPLLSNHDLQQVSNARVVVDAGGAVMRREDETDVDDLRDMVEELLADPERLAGMADAARAWSRPDAAEAIIDLVL